MNPSTDAAPNATLQYIGKTTFKDVLKGARASLKLVNELAKALAESNGVKLATDTFRIPALTVFDGDTYDPHTPWGCDCDDACLAHVPAFFGAPAPILFICRRCRRKACWRHSTTDKTGGWCIPCKASIDAVAPSHAGGDAKTG